MAVHCEFGDSPLRHPATYLHTHIHTYTHTWNSLPAELTTPVASCAILSVISRHTFFIGSRSLRCCWHVGSALFVRRRCDCLASLALTTNIQTYLLTHHDKLNAISAPPYFVVGADNNKKIDAYRWRSSI